MNVGVLENMHGIQEEYQRAAVRVNHLPYFYEIHLSMPCNQKCIMCVPDGKHPADQLSLQQFTELFERIRPYAQLVTLIGGETFMYPWFNEVLDMLAQEPVTVTILTNATLLTEKVTPRLLALHGLELKFSVDAATRNTYYRIRGRDVFDNVMANIARFSERTRDMPHVRRIFNYVVMRENLREVLDFVDIAHRLDMYRVDFQPVKHVKKWRVQNGTGWLFEGKSQICESFPDEYNDVMMRARDKCDALGLGHDIRLL